MVAGTLGALLAVVAPASATVPLGAAQRVSAIGPEGVASAVDPRPSVAYDAVANRYLVVWVDDRVPAAGTEVYGRFLGADGTPVGEPIQISQMGSSPTDGLAAFGPNVAWNPRTREFLVAWAGEDDGDGFVDTENEIYVQRLAADGTQVGADDLRISLTGPAGQEAGAPAFDAFRPVIAVDDGTGEYVVVWRADDDADQDFEVQGRVLGPAAELLTDEVQITDIGPPGESAYQAGDPDVAFNAAAGRYLVVVEGNEVGDPDINDVDFSNYEIYAQLLDRDLAEVGPDDRRLSVSGPGRTAVKPAVAVDPLSGRTLVVWHGDANQAGRFEIRGQMLSAAGEPDGTGPGQVLSAMEPLGDARPDAFDPDVEFRPGVGEFLLAWRGVLTAGPALDDEVEVFARPVTNAGVPKGSQLRVSAMGPDADVRYDAGRPRLVAGGERRVQAVWAGDDVTIPGVVDGQAEVFGRQWGPAPPPVRGAGDPPVAPERPAAESGDALRIRQRSARITGFVDPAGQEVSYWVEFGTDRTMSRRSAVQTTSGEGRRAVSVELTGLPADRRVFYRLVAEGPGGRTEGAVLRFRTWEANTVQLALEAPARCQLDARRAVSACAFTRLALRMQLRNPNTERPVTDAKALSGIALRIVCRRGCRLDRRARTALPRLTVGSIAAPPSRFSTIVTIPPGPRRGTAVIEMRRRGALVEADLTQLFSDGTGAGFLFRPGAEVHLIATRTGFTPALARVRFTKRMVEREICTARGERAVACRSR